MLTTIWIIKKGLLYIVENRGKVIYLKSHKNSMISLIALPTAQFPAMFSL